MQSIDIKVLKKKVKLVSQTEQYRFLSNHRCIVIAKVFQFNENNVVGYVVRPIDNENVARYIEKDSLEFMMFKNNSFTSVDVVNADVVRRANGTIYIRVRDIEEIKKDYEALQKTFGGQMYKV